MTRPHTPRRPAVTSTGVLLPAVLLLAAAAALAWAPRAALYSRTAKAVEGSPVGGAVGLLADRGLLLLVALAGGLAVLSWLRDRRAFTLLLVGGLGAVGAYGASEAIKALVQQERPCRTLDVATVLACPAAGDWSWPSNHSTIAASLTVACLLVAPRLWPVLVPLGLAIALARVGAGVHYVHDVASGLALGTLVTGTAARAAAAALGRRPGAGGPGQRPDGAVRGGSRSGPTRHASPGRPSVPGPASRSRQTLKTPQVSMDRVPVTGGSADQGNVIHRSVSRQE